MASILVVDDNSILVRSLERLLHERGGYDVTTVQTSEEAVERLRFATFDLVMIDLYMPGRNGFWLLKTVHEKWPALPCLVLSGIAEKLYVKDAMAEGARGYVLKDDLPGILDGVRAVLGGGTFISEAVRPE